MMIQNDSMETPQTRRAILVVEDNDMNRELLCAILEDSFDVLEAENGLVGLEQLERNYEHLSLVLLDVYMPVCDGFEFLRRKQAEERFDSVPVIVTTASNALEDEIECLRLGANDFVIKPYNVDIILNRINNIIHLRESASIVNQLTWDNLTGLYSREFFFRHVNGITSTSSEETFDIVCCKIMNFSMLNDRYGKSNCDGMVRELASRISGVLPDFMAGGRLGNEVFGFLIKHQEDPNWTQCLSETAKGLMATNLHLNFGIMESISRGLLASRACDRALLAMEEIRDTFGVSIAWYNDELREKQVHEHVILETMEQALEEHQFTVYYQPKHDTQTEEVGGAEALVRWIHPDLGFVRPDHFIPVFERNGFITKLDLYVFEVGENVEDTKVEVSPDLVTWYDAGVAAGRTAGVDFQGTIPSGTGMRYVRLTDLRSHANGTWPGADIDAVCGIHSRAPSTDTSPVYDYETIQIVLNGHELTPTDRNGTVVEPVLINGTV